MPTILEKLRELKKENQERKELIDSILKNTDVMIKEIGETTKKLQESIDRIDDTLEGFDDFVNFLYTEISKLKKDLKNNPWLRFFGFK